jgi:hypothetical protein
MIENATTEKNIFIETDEMKEEIDEEFTELKDHMDTSEHPSLETMTSSFEEQYEFKIKDLCIAVLEDVIIPELRKCESVGAIDQFKKENDIYLEWIKKLSILTNDERQKILEIFNKNEKDLKVELSLNLPKIKVEDDMASFDGEKFPVSKASGNAQKKQSWSVEPKRA